MKKMLLVILVLVCGGLLAQSAAAECQECANLEDEKGQPLYPGIMCAPVSISDHGYTECVVEIEVGQPIICKFSGDSCAWEPPDTNGECDGTHVTSLNPNEDPEQVVTPNGKFKRDWTPRLKHFTAVEG